MTTKSACKFLTRAIFLLSLVVFNLVASDTPEAELSLSIPEAPTPITYPDQYVNSRFHQECLKKSPNDCRCTSLWDSPCNCDGRDKSPLESVGNFTGCDCGWLCEELWIPHRPLSESMRYKCQIPQVRKYAVKAFIGSKHIESAEVLVYMKRLAEVMGGAIDLSIHYVIYLQGDRLGSLRGQPEIIGDMIGKCAMHLYPEPSVYLPFLACMAMNTSLVPQNFFNCTQLHSVSYSSIRSCVNTQGESLLANDLLALQHYRVEIPTRVYMDERYFNPGRVNEYLSYESALCYVFGNSTRPFPWFIFFIMGSLVLLLAVLFFTIKRWSHTSFIDNIQSLFLWNQTNHDPMDTLLYLRAYGLMEDASDGENEQNDPSLPPDDSQHTENQENTDNNPESNNTTRRRRRIREASEENDTSPENSSSRRSRRRRSRRQRNSSRRTQNTDSIIAATSSEPTTDPETQIHDPSVPLPSNQPQHDIEQCIELDSIPDYYYSSDDDEDPGSQARLLLPH